MILGRGDRSDVPGERSSRDAPHPRAELAVRGRRLHGSSYRAQSVARRISGERVPSSSERRDREGVPTAGLEAVRSCRRMTACIEDVVRGQTPECGKLRDWQKKIAQAKCPRDPYLSRHKAMPTSLEIIRLRRREAYWISIRRGLLSSAFGIWIVNTPS